MENKREGKNAQSLFFFFSILFIFFVSVLVHEQMEGKVHTTVIQHSTIGFSNSITSLCWRMREEANNERGIIRRQIDFLQSARGRALSEAHTPLNTRRPRKVVYMPQYTMCIFYTHSALFNGPCMCFQCTVTEKEPVFHETLELTAMPQLSKKKHKRAGTLSWHVPLEWKCNVCAYSLHDN